jgi:hypothetical protein
MRRWLKHRDSQNNAHRIEQQRRRGGLSVNDQAGSRSRRVVSVK